MKLYCKAWRLLPERTVSILYVDGKRLCYVLEDGVRERQGEPVEAWKIPNRTAIPSGIYEVTAENSPKFGPDTLTINDVPGFQFIRLHGGNDENDTEGCPLVGNELTANFTIKFGTSQPALRNLRPLVLAALQVGEKVWWEVDRNVGADDDKRTTFK